MNISEYLDKGLVIASNNSGKVLEFRKYLAEFPVQILLQEAGLEIEETGKSFAENSRIKSLAVSKLTNCLTLADDSGLCVSALGGAPGVLSARYAPTDFERIRRLLTEMKDSKDRSAFFSAALCLSSPEGVLIEVEGRCNGAITNSPRGQGGFGYDPVFEVEGTGLTFAEMTIETKRKYGHRGKAFQLFKSKFEDHLSNGRSL